MRHAICAAIICTTGLVAKTADACGGFFCSQTQPVNQAAERIIFSTADDGSVTSIVQILYQGPSKKFSWILPVPAIPTVGVSSNAAFQRLQSATNPSYRLTTTVEGTCAQNFNRNQAVAFGSPGPAEEDGAPTVDVVAAGNVGPYDYEVIQVNSGSGDKAQVAIDWLSSNGYDVTSVGPTLLRPYLEQGDLLLAFRLNKESDSGDIRPVWLTFKDDRPMIPIKLTAVAAQDDMGVMVWVMGKARAIPANYRHLKLNEAAINWLTGASNYNAVVNLAADEAGGQGFVTEYAQPTTALANIVVTENDRAQWASLKASAFDVPHLIDLLNNAFRNWDGAADVFKKYEDSTDKAALLAEFELNVIKPMFETQDFLGTQPFVTRMYSTLSAAEMTVDPEFDYNPDLPAVSNLHVANRVIECNAFVEQSDAKWRVELSNGLIVRGSGFTWPIKLGEDVPANLVIEQLSTSGVGDVVRDNTTANRTGLSTANQRTLGSGCRCHASDPDLSALLLAAIVGLRLFRRGARASVKTWGTTKASQD